MATVTGLYEYPVTVDSDEFTNYTGIDLYAELEGDDGERKVSNFLNTVHSIIYDGLLYSVGSKTIKNLMIEHFTDDLGKDIKKAIIAQGEYLLDNGDISLWNGTVITANGTADIKESKVMYQKIVSPRSVSVLMDTNPPLLYMGVLAMAFPIKYDMSCVLIDLETQQELAQFKARRIREKRIDAAFEAGNVASGGQTFSIATSSILNFKPYAHQVICEGLTYLIVAYQPLTHTQAGKTWSYKRQSKEIVLELE